MALGSDGDIGARDAMSRYADGDESAFGEIYDALAPRLHGFLRRAVREPALAEDLLQQTFLHLHRARGTYVRGADVVPWAFAIARRLVIDAARRSRSRPVVTLDRDAVRELACIDADQDQAFAALELEERLQRAYDLLPASQRTAFNLVKREGLTFQQAAQVLGTTVPAVKLRAHRAYDALRRVVPGSPS